MSSTSVCTVPIVASLSAAACLRPRDVSCVSSLVRSRYMRESRSGELEC